MLGRRPAAATDDPGAGRQQAWRDGPEVLGARRIDEAPLESLREPGVGHDRSRRLAIGGTAHRLEGVQTGGRPRPAVDADCVRTRASERGGGDGRVVAVGQKEFLPESQRGDDRDVRRAARLVDGEDQLLQVRERLEHDQVRPTLEQALDLLAEDGSRDRVGEDRTTTRRRTQGPDRAANQCVASTDLACLARKLCGTPVERAHLALETPSGQSLSVGTERQGLDQLGARFEVLPVGGADHLRMGRDEFLEAGSLRHATAEQQRPKAAVDQQRAVGETAAKALARRAERRGVGHRSPIERVGSGGGTGNDKTLPARKGLEGSSLIVQEHLPGLGTLPARCR